MPASLRDLAKCEVVYESFPGWTKDISNITKFEELPREVSVRAMAAAFPSFILLATLRHCHHTKRLPCTQTPSQAQQYVLRIEQLLKVKIRWIGTGGDRNSSIER